MNYETILFDIDDTLIDFPLSEKNALFQTIELFGLTIGYTELHADYRKISIKLWAELELGQISLATLGVERFHRLFAKHRIRLDAEQFNRAYLANLGKQAPLIEGAKELCQHLIGYRLAAITNGFKHTQHSRMKESPLCDTIQQIFTSEEAGWQKPDNRIFEYVFSKLKLDADDKPKTLIVGDSLTSDIQGGNRFGIDTCWFNRYGAENNTTIKPTYEISKLTDLFNILPKR